MTQPLQRPVRKNPQLLTRAPACPPSARSRKALAFSAFAAEGRFCLQRCTECEKVCYPPRDTCPACWSAQLEWQDMAAGGQLLTETTLRSSVNTYFRERLPWRIGTVQLDAGPTVLAHLHGDVSERGRVRIIARTDHSGQGVLMALPDKETPNMADDPQLRTLTCDPKFRRVLITDGRTELGQCMARAVAEAGAARVFVGIAEDWRPFKGSDSLSALSEVETVPLDLTDNDSVEKLAAAIGGQTDILINTAEFVRPGGGIEGRGVVTARDEMEINYFGLLRLIQSFAPAMKSRGSDGDNSACAWVNLLSVYALSNWPVYGTSSASQAAAYSLNQCLRGELAGSGVKVINVLSGPLEGAWQQSLPPPKVTPENLARAAVNALRQGIESVALGPVAEDVVRRFNENPRVLGRELLQKSVE